MTRKSFFQPGFFCLLTALIVSLSAASAAVGQGKPDLEVKVETASDIARGGEAFPHTITVTNIGAYKAVDVIVNSDQDQSASYLKVVSSLSAKGSCRTYEFHYRERLACNLGDLSPGQS